MTAAGRAHDGDRRADPSEAERVASAVLGVRDVVSMSAGPFGQFRSYLPGGDTVPGVRVDAEKLDVNVVTRYGPPLPELSRRIGVALEPLRNGRTLTIGIDDVLLPGDPAPDEADSIVEAKPVPVAVAGNASDRTDPDHRWRSR